MERKVLIFPRIEKLNDFAAEKFIEIGNDAIEKNDRFAVALAGGSTPKSLYRLLSGEQFKNRIDWSKVFFFFGDERGVLPDSAESNFRMANENLLKPLEIPEENIFRWQTELENSDKIVESYNQKIKDFFAPDKTDFPRFDLILLGMGTDGHTASLFPFTDALNETEKQIVSNRVEKLETVRFTFTFSLINNAANVFFLVSGADKAEVLKRVLEGEFAPLKYPSQGVSPKNGKLFWLIDESAAQLLTSVEP